MPTIVPTSMGGPGDRVVAVTTLGASDTFVYDRSKNPVLILNNASGGALTPVIDGDGSTTFPCDGIGNIDVSAGVPFSQAIGIGEIVAIPLNSVSAFLVGTITVTSGVGIEAQLLEF